MNINVLIRLTGARVTAILFIIQELGDPRKMTSFRLLCMCKGHILAAVPFTDDSCLKPVSYWYLIGFDEITWGECQQTNTPFFLYDSKCWFETKHPKMKTFLSYFPFFCFATTVVHHRLGEVISFLFEDYKAFTSLST